MRAMERDKELRYSDCRAMHADLEQFIIASRTPVTAFQIAELVRQAEEHLKAPPPAAEPLQPALPVPPAPPPEPVITKTDLHPYPMERTDVAIQLPFGPPEPAKEPPSDPGPEPTSIRPPPVSRPAPIRPRAVIAGAVALAAVVSALVWMQGSPEPPAPSPPPPPRAAPPAPAQAVTVRPSPPPERRASAKEFMERGRALLKAKDYEQAMTEFEACLEVDPHMADCHLGLGSTYARMHRPERGAEHYRKYLDLEPEGSHAPEVRKLLDAYDAERGETPATP
jgi:tetratricopeptide (TPR) repeat protein